MAVGKKVRFEVFKRDNFTCQYCGRQAPDVTLHVDHINPKANDGDDDILNLVTSCVDCNIGKGARLLSDHSTVMVQHRQLAELQERREQLELMLEWQKELLAFERDQAHILSDFWNELTGYIFTDEGLRRMANLLADFTITEICTAMRLGLGQYGNTQAGRSKALGKLGGICYNRRDQRKT